ncbi:hypothetical protein MNB_SM-6-1435 [hydrothermal vent metagenome]|uniref:Uncharacterized protein n=1 Tax=hydrothermal vent metagenome TaxID=652676 RepID=A0A1W1C9S9_9ZZZZ
MLHKKNPPYSIDELKDIIKIDKLKYTPFETIDTQEGQNATTR